MPPPLWCNVEIRPTYTAYPLRCDYDYNEYEIPESLDKGFNDALLDTRRTPEARLNPELDKAFHVRFDEFMVKRAEK